MIGDIYTCDWASPAEATEQTVRSTADEPTLTTRQRKRVANRCSKAARTAASMHAAVADGRLCVALPPAPTRYEECALIERVDALVCVLEDFQGSPGFELVLNALCDRSCSSCQLVTLCNGPYAMENAPNRSARAKCISKRRR